MNDWENDKRWSDRFLPEIKAILGRFLIKEASREEDAERNTDLVVLKMDSVRIACRIRRNAYLGSYGNQFTIRSGRPSGIKTELTKIVEGWGNFLFYGFSNKEETQIEQWKIADLNVFRLEFNRKICALPRLQIPGYTQKNQDRSSSFLAFDWCQFSKGLVVAQGTNKEFTSLKIAA